MRASGSALFRPSTSILAPRRLLFTLAASAILGIPLTAPSIVPWPLVLGRSMIVGLCTLVVFGVLERRPSRLPRGIARWVVQLVGVSASVPLAAFFAYWITTGGPTEFSDAQKRGLGYLIALGLLAAPWIALGAMVRQREAFAREQALEFELRRSELERTALDARWKQLQAQVEPHFIFNTLANVQALVDAGSPRASQVLASLTTYLRAAVPRLNEPTSTVGRELELVRAYLELMHVRMPDRLRFSIETEGGAESVSCPPATLLTLVENAVRHGIDPQEAGGEIAIDVRVRHGRCRLRVSDTGAGIGTLAAGSGTGLDSLRQRLRLMHGAECEVELRGLEPHGACATAVFPARNTAA